MEDEDAVDGCVIEPVEHFPRVTIPNADIGELAILKRAKQCGHAVDVRFTPDQPNLRVRFSLPGEMLTGTEADFQPDV